MNSLVDIKLFYCPRGKAGLDTKSWRFVLPSDEPATFSQHCLRLTPSLSPKSGKNLHYSSESIN